MINGVENSKFQCVILIDFNRNWDEFGIKMSKID